MSVYYSSGIRIQNKRIGQGVETLPVAKATEFIDATRTALDDLRRTRTGNELIQAIDASGHRVDIYRGWSKDTGNSQGGDSGTPGIDMFVALDTVHGNGETELGVVLGRACADMSKRSALKKFFGIGKAAPRFLSMDGVSKLIGIGLKDLEAMALGRKAIPAPVDAKLRVYLYDFLTPGKGESCRVTFNHRRDNLSAEHKKYLPSSHTWAHRPPAIGLGHELVHAWRVVSGRVLFTYGWEEEAMTVGLPPFGNMKFSENRIRVEWGGLAIRPDYQNIQMKTGLVDPKQAGLNPANGAWTGNQKSLHANQKMAQAMSQRRAAMGYDDEDDDDF
ncbi:MAG: hypothetical protein J7603_05020 [Pseudacidovorax sp.]|nr:hypothetical protein [Pseudacidovorax sp.]